jgi:SOS-response transcriptional repressor LexA
MSSATGAFSWNSELPNGHSPFWIRDEALAGLGLHAGDAVSVDTRAEAQDGDLVVVEAEVDGDSQRLARRLFFDGHTVRLETVTNTQEVLELDSESIIVMGVIVARLRFSVGGDQAIEEELAKG